MTTVSVSRHIFSDLEIDDTFEVPQHAIDLLIQRIHETPPDVRPSLAMYVPNADPHQRRVIEASEETIRVVAPAGSGKTQTMINRALTRVRTGLNPGRFLILTFDTAAASSLRSKLQGQLTAIGTQLPGLRISTLNSFGYGLLREHVSAEYKPVIPDFRRRRVFREVRAALKAKSIGRFQALPTNIEERFYLQFFSLLKNELFDPRDPVPQRFADFLLAAPQAQPFFTGPKDAEVVRRVVQALLWLYQAYERVLQREALLDFDDQKLRAYSALMGDPSLLRGVQDGLSEIIVDEFQDINRLDFELIRMVAQRSVLVVTGDDDQAIYGFRGCTPDFIIDLERHLKRRVASYELQVNYRCPPNIIASADRLIRHNRHRIPKTPLAYSKTPSEIKVVSTLSAAVEAKLIVSFIKRVRSANPTVQYHDVAVLYRTNAQSLPLQIEFILNDLPYSVRDEDNILSNQILDRLLGVLRLKLALMAGESPVPHDASLTVRAYFRYVDTQLFDRLDPFFTTTRDFMRAIGSEDFHRLMPKARESLFATSVAEVVRSRSLLDVLDVLSKRFAGLAGMIGSLEDVLDERAPLGEIYDIARGFRGNVAVFVKTIDQALERARASGAGKDRAAGVALLTYFRSKGLQWHTVILTTCNEGLIPHAKAAIEDERRLFYVAMTRASSTLLISYVKNACSTKVMPSRFLAEAALL